jgi:exodeoxyribonuclease V alpha subunit
VGPGNFLRDAINAGVFRVVVLKEIFRQAEESMIVRNAHRINQGEGPEYKKGERGKGDFFFIRKDETGQVLAQIKELCSRILPHRYGLDRMEDIQVICPMNRGEVGAWNLNIELQKTLNPRGPEIIRGVRIFRLGDRVMQVRNNYDKNVYNGDLGRITRVHREEGKLMVDFDGQILEYSSDELDELTLAYAMSVHKSQGSEYPAVVMPMVTQHFPLLQRNLLYTAVSRARKLVILVGNTKAMYIAINNDKVQERYTHFVNRLTEGSGPHQESLGINGP